MKKVLFVFGTRPEAIKCCPVALEMKKRDCFDVKVCVTGQHREMLRQVLDAFSIRPDYDLAVMKKSQTLFELTSNMLGQICAVLEKEKPEIVLVHGDTTTAFAAGLASFYMEIPVGHIEAGLRTYNLYSPFPEEFNRQAIGLVAAYHFAPTEAARENLLKEGKDASSIWVTGNTSIDALRTTVRDDYRHALLDWAGNRRLVVLTAHRRENCGEPMRQMMRAIRRSAKEFSDVAVVFPAHPNPVVQETAKEILGDCRNIKIISPLDVIDFHNIIARSYLILTDSGGIQEEAPALGKPVLVMRDTTERPEGVAAGTLRLVGTEEESIYQSFAELLTDKEVYARMSRASNPYGDGFASKRIADALQEKYISGAACFTAGHGVRK